MNPMTPVLLGLAMLALITGTLALFDFLSDRKHRHQRQHRRSG